ncbi:MAG: hypothetical protein ACE5JP_09805 [Candidatus Bipolaricaulia bacterium]
MSQEHEYQEQAERILSSVNYCSAIDIDPAESLVECPQCGELAYVKFLNRCLNCDETS